MAWDTQSLDDSEQKDRSLINKLITKVFVEQSRLHRVC